MTDDLERRLREALHSKALPDAPDTLRTFLERLPAMGEAASAKSGRRRIAWLVPAVMAATGVALFLGAWLGGHPPSASSSAVLSPSPTAVATMLAHVSRWGLTFDYPATWKLTESNVSMHYITVLGFVGSGSRGQPCAAVTPPPGQSLPYGVQCHAVWDLPAGTVVVRFESLHPPGSDSPIVGGPRPGFDPTEVGGLPALFSRTAETVPTSDETLSWILSVPGDPGGSYHLTAGIRGPDVAGLEVQLFALVSSIRYDPPVEPLPMGAAAGPGAAAASSKAIAQLQAASDAYACFPSTPGAVNAAVVTIVPTMTLKKPLPVRCSTSIEPTMLQLWRLTLIYRWDAASDRTGGSTSIEMYLTPDGTRVGPIVGPGTMPYGP